MRRDALPENMPMPETPAPCRIAMVIFPRMTQLDLTGPFEVLARMPGAKVDLLWHHIEPVKDAQGLTFTPTATFSTYGTPDILFIPGGPGVLEAMQDEYLIAFVRSAGEGASLVTSVCTGSLVLGAAGLLKGKRATTHWGAIEQLALLGAIPTPERVVVDGNTVTGAGVTSGIDFGLAVVAKLHGEEKAREIQLQIEYDPHPPYDSGSVRSASPELVARLKRRSAGITEQRRAAAERIGRTLGAPGSAR
ncbi:cyclohexyl-isocyanide hydratase [Constrictibacter sp. MBR-5]|jgi:cyclohexyl-isocyanide hydratase|uniref:DJ-1/PfpI family protein n=1 Tax=Constrictibacter sp. MBR-5 TaxID=3156467 RepID=UPI003397C5AD